MPLTDREKQTQANYNLKALDWLRASGGENRKPFWATEMAHLVDLMQANAREHGYGNLVADIGAGPATDSTQLKNAGLNVLSFDYSRGMLNLAKELNPSLNLAEADTYYLPLPKESLDGFWACASILHLEDTQKSLLELNRVTKVHAVGFISVKEGEGEAIDERTGYYFKYQEDPIFQELINACGFKIEATGRKTGTPRHEWLTYHVRKI
jgi:ubiquinone/menaquinone biosynthesis C-methylase UbiE